MCVISLWFLSANVPSTGRTRAAGRTGTSVCLWKTPWCWWTTPSANSAYSRSDLSAAILPARKKNVVTSLRAKNPALVFAVSSHWLQLMLRPGVVVF